MYQVPLKFIKIGQIMAVCATRIVAILSTESYQARRILIAERKAGTLINGAGKSKTKSVIFLDNGSVCSSPYSVQVILNSIQKSTAKDFSSKAQGAKIMIENPLHKKTDQQIFDDVMKQIESKEKESQFEGFDQEEMQNEQYQEEEQNEAD